MPRRARKPTGLKVRALTGARTMARGVPALFLPGGLLFFAAAILAGSGLAARISPAVLELLPFVIWTVGILLAWRFNRNRLVLAFLVLALADRILWQTAGDPELSGLVRAAAAILVPCNLVIISLLRERGVMVVAGRSPWPLLGLACQPAAGAFLFRFLPAETERWLRGPLLPLEIPGQHLLAQPALLAFGAALLLFGFRMARRREPLEKGFFWATAASAGALAVSPGPLPWFSSAWAG